MSKWKLLEPASAADDILIDVADVTDADQCRRYEYIQLIGHEAHSSLFGAGNLR